MSNKVGLIDIINRLEHDIYTLTNQELNWHTRVMINNFREKIKDLEITFLANDLDNQHPVAQVIINELKSFLDAEEKRLNANLINE